MRGGPAGLTRGGFPVKSTMIMRAIANPRRTTLVEPVEVDGVETSAPARQETEELPARTANPRRTTLVDAPVG